MAEIYLIKQASGSLGAADEEALKHIGKLKIGTVYRATIVKPRNYEFHKKYFALLNLAFDNQEKYEAFDPFRDAVTMQAGWYDSHISLGSGELIYKPKSISFGSMGDAEFSDLYSKTIDVILKYVMVGSTQDEIERVLGFC